MGATRAVRGADTANVPMSLASFSNCAVRGGEKRGAPEMLASHVHPCPMEIRTPLEHNSNHKRRQHTAAHGGPRARPQGRG